MARDLNKIQIIGRLGGDPELRYTQTEKQVANFSVATNNRYTTSSGDKRDDVSWHRIVVWGKAAEVASKYLRKGSRVYLEGRLSYRVWTNNEGQEVKACEIVADDLIFLDAAGGGDRGELVEGLEGRSVAVSTK